MTTTTLPHRPVVDLRAAVTRHAERLKEALRRAFSLTSPARPQDEYIRALKKSVLSSDRCKAVELVVALVVDLANRGTEEEAAAIGEALIAIARVEYAAAHPGEERRQLSRAEAHIAEEIAQGVRENAECAMANFPTLGNLLKFLGADAAYCRAARELRLAVQREAAVS